MCSTCNDRTYGQSQDAARKADATKLAKVRAAMEARARKVSN